MKLGSIVGIVLSMLLIISGIVMCVIGNQTAASDGQHLFTERIGEGTLYTQKITEDIKRIKIECDTAEIKILGGAEKSHIEFKNFNPNYYSLSTTPNVISFEEIQEFDSIVDIWENGINFKGLRYALDLRNYSDNDLKKSITIHIGGDSDINTLDISAASSNVSVDALSFNGDISLNVLSGSVTVNGLTTSSQLNISGSSVKTSLKDANAYTLKYNVKSSEISIENSLFNDALINVDDGRIDYHSVETFDAYSVSIASEEGGLLVNDLPHSGAIFSEPEEFTKILKIKCKSAGINLTYPENLETENTENAVNG